MNYDDKDKSNEKSGGVLLLLLFISCSHVNVNTSILKK